MLDSRAEWWRTVSPVLDEVLDLPEVERPSWVASLRERDPALAADIEALLDEHRAASRAGFLEGTPVPCLSPPLAAGTVIGSYTLVAPIGEGGMGSVWLGERRDGELQQRVAIKFVSAAGHRPSWGERFLRERQLLASLDHPAIVRVIDAGRTETGIPFLVMEYVEGRPIDVAAADLPIGDRLRTFAQVCDAVWYAHRRLIVHRDLKPSNILVDVNGRPKLLDFGIARLLEDSVDAIDATRTVDRLLTPGYASPEQLRGAPQTTATDVYSLGAVLYKLLTGCSLSEATKTAPGADSPAGIPLARKLNPMLPADADSVLRKALRAEPEERYASVDALARDVRALADGRPVDARAGDVWYRTRKLARRYWMPALAAVLVVSALSTGLFVAERARAQADRRFEQIQRLAAQVIALDRSIRDLPGSEQARRNLVSMMLGYLERLRVDAQGDTGLMQELAEGYTHVAEVQGVPNGPSLGEPAQADASLAKADALIAGVIQSKPADRSALVDAATISEERMILADTNGHDAEALRRARQAADRLARLARSGALSPRQRTAVATIYSNVAQGFLNLHHYDEAIPLAQRSAQISRDGQGSGFVLGTALSVLASALRDEGRLDEALRSIDEADAASRTASYPNNQYRVFDRYGVLMRKGSILGADGTVSLDRPEDAAPAFQAALDSMEALARADPHDATSRSRVGTAGRALGDVLRDRDPRRAMAAYDRAIARLREIRSGIAPRRSEAMTLAASAHALRRLGRLADGRRRIDEAMALLRSLGDLPAHHLSLDSAAAVVLREEADQLADEGQRAAAAARYEHLVEIAAPSAADLAGDLPTAAAMSQLYEGLAKVYRREGAVAQAEATIRRQLALWQPWQRELPNNAFVERQMAAAHLP